MMKKDSIAAVVFITVTLILVLDFWGQHVMKKIVSSIDDVFVTAVEQDEETLVSYDTKESVSVETLLAGPYTTVGEKKTTIVLYIPSEGIKIKKDGDACLAAMAYWPDGSILTEGGLLQLANGELYDIDWLERRLTRAIEYYDSLGIIDYQGMEIALTVKNEKKASGDVGSVGASFANRAFSLTRYFSLEAAVFAAAATIVAPLVIVLGLLSFVLIRRQPKVKHYGGCRRA